MPSIKSSDLVVNQEISAAAPDAQLTIQIDPAAPLRTGTYQFQLVVTDDSGNNSQPATVNVVIIDDQAPTAILDAPERVGFGKEFALSGKRSIDAGGGSITKFVWTLIKTP